MFLSSLFISLVLYAVNFSSETRGPDFSWLKHRNMSGFVRPGDPATTLLEPSGRHFFVQFYGKSKLVLDRYLVNVTASFILGQTPLSKLFQLNVGTIALLNARKILV